MAKRLVLGPVMILLLLAGLWFDQWLDSRPAPAALSGLLGQSWPPGVVIFVVVGVLATLGARELAAILRDKGILASKRISVFAALLGLCVSCFIPAHLLAMDAVAIVSMSAMLVLAVSMVFFARYRTVEGIVAATGGALLAYVYLGLMFGFLLAIRREHSVWALLWVLMATKACDIGAYFTGTAIGRHKLIPWLSPGKTWEGLAGGVAFSCIAGAAGAKLLYGVGAAFDVRTLGLAAAAAGVLGLVGQAGDLLESILKRDAGIKDSGRVLPGFGGILDVIDSPLLVGPFAYWWLRWLDGLS
jgi:phosphatidate cytidylyltransferase